MLTECPSCLTVFRVTGAILKVGHGQVRCGKCRTQFDALESLLDEDDSESSATPAPSSPRASASRSEPEERMFANPPPQSEEITLEGSRIEISGTYRMPPKPSSGDAVEQVIREHLVIDREEDSDDDEADADDEDDEAYESEEDESEEVEIIDIGDDGEPVDEAAQHLLADDEAETDKAIDEMPQVAPISQRLLRRSHADALQNAANKDIDAELHALTRPARKDERRGLWIGLAVAMIVTLAAQAIHHRRDDLIRSPKWGNSVARVYRSLGLALPPNWDLKAYELQVWDVTMGNERDTLRVRASVTNNAAFAQPYPHIKLALEDRWGGVVATRAFKPEEYLPSNVATDRLMAPRQRANAEIAVVDPGADAVGFKSDACLPTKEDGTDIQCRDDSPFVR